ncbi:ABC transporter transmembrane domain-containing protein, partial [Candidatus Pelagibacter sp.]|nr:ABC transporter transmembrane domain-containing protein [Candidatus Pelagibacter sp.]
MQTIKNFLYLLTPRERKQAGLLLLMMLIMALLDMVGVASIVPFMAVLANPDIVESNLILNQIFKATYVFGVKNNQQFLFALGVLVFLLLVTSLVFKAITTYVQARFVHMRQYTIGKRLVEGYLNQPYSWFLNRHSADLGKTILSEVGHVVGGGMSPLMEAIAKSMVAVAIIALLFFTDPKLTVIVGLIFLVAYGLTYKFSRGYLHKIGEENLNNNQLRYTAV